MLLSKKSKLSPLQEELETLFRTVQKYYDTLSKVNGAEVTEAEKNTLKKNRDIILRKSGMF